MSAAANKPNLSEDEMRHWLRVNYAIEGDLELLPGESDLNYKLNTETGEKFVCKISNTSEDELKLLAAQNEVMALLEQTDLGAIPKVISSNQGESLVPLNHYIGRVLTYVPGTVLAECVPYTEELTRDLGRTVGRLNQALAGYDHPAFHYEFDWDLAHSMQVVERYRNLITDPLLSKAVDEIFQDFESIVAPRFNRLKQSVIHNDANDYNVLAEGNLVTGLIDFGDMVYTYTICDLAIALAYATLGGNDPLQVMREMVPGYNEFMPIEDNELTVLFPMMRMRLAVSACMAGHQMRLRPDDPYLSISQEPIRNTLPKLMALEVEEVKRLLKEALA